MNKATARAMERRMTASMYKAVDAYNTRRNLGHWPVGSRTPEDGMRDYETRRPPNRVDEMSRDGVHALPIGTVGQRILKARAVLGYSLVMVQERTGIAPSYLSRWEHDQVVPRPSNLQRLAAVLEVSVEWLRSGRD